MTVSPLPITTTGSGGDTVLDFAVGQRPRLFPWTQGVPHGVEIGKHGGNLRSVGLFLFPLADFATHLGQPSLMATRNPSVSNPLLLRRWLQWRLGFQLPNIS